MLLLFPALLIAPVLILITIIVAFLTFYKSCFSYFKNREINHLEPSIPFGNAAGFFLGKRNFGETFHDWYLEIKNRGWPIGGAYFCGKPVYIPVDQNIVKSIMISDFITFPNHGLYINGKNDPLSQHIFNMEGYAWKNLRAKMPAAFTAAKMRRHVVVMEKLVRKLLERIDEHAQRNEPVEIKTMLSRFTIDSISACGFGMNTQLLEDKNLELLTQTRPFFDEQWSRTSNALVVLVPRHILSFFRFKLFPKSTTKYFMNLFKNIKEQRAKESTQRNDIADLLLDLCNETKTHPDFNGKGQMNALTFEEFAAQMYVFLEAGFETSSSTQTLALYELAANPLIQDTLRKEVNTVLARYGGEVGYDAVNEMEYLDRVIDETLRKYPIFPILPRACLEDYKVPGTDITIEKNSFVMVTNLGIQRDPEFYPEPDKFDPDRFLSENKAKRPHCSYMPFGEGPRICVGKRFGIWQTKIGILSIVRDYKISLSKKMKLPFSFDKSGLILKAKGEVWLDLEKIHQKTCL